VIRTLLDTGAIDHSGDFFRYRLLAAFYIPSMPPALLERHGIDSADVDPINAAFAAGDIEQALAATPDELADRIVLPASLTSGWPT
jgi:hypothetical protein